MPKVNITKISYLSSISLRFVADHVCWKSYGFIC